MSDWNERPAGLAELMRAAHTDAPSPERLARISERLAGPLGPLGPVGAAPRAKPSAPPPADVALPTPAQPIASALVGVALVALILWQVPRPGSDAPRSGPARAPSTVSAPEPALPSDHLDELAVEPPPAAPVAAPSAAEPPTTGRRERLAPRATEPVSGSDTASDELDEASSLREEIALIERAMAARDAGDPAEARALIDRHRARFPRGRLALERDRLAAQLAEPEGERAIETDLVDPEGDPPSDLP